MSGTGKNPCRPRSRTAIGNHWCLHTSAIYYIGAGEQRRGLRERACVYTGWYTPKRPWTRNNTRIFYYYTLDSPATAWWLVLRAHKQSPRRTVPPAVADVSFKNVAAAAATLWEIKYTPSGCARCTPSSSWWYNNVKKIRSTHVYAFYTCTYRCIPGTLYVEFSAV